MKAARTVPRGPLFREERGLPYSRPTALYAARVAISDVCVRKGWLSEVGAEVDPEVDSV